MRVLIFLGLFLTLGLSQFAVKHLAGPPEDFAYHQIPDPKNTVEIEKSTFEYIWLEIPTLGDVVKNVQFPVDGDNEFIFTFASPLEKDLVLELFDPNQKQVDLESIRQVGTFPVWGTTVPISTYVVKNSIRGIYNLVIRTTTLSPSEIKTLSQSDTPNAILTIFNDDDVEIHTHLNTYLIKVGEPIGLIANIVSKNPSTESIHINTALMEVFTPDGKDVRLDMKQDFSSSSDSPAYAASMTAVNPGEYVLQATLFGTFDETSPVLFERSTQHIILVSSATVELSGTAELANSEKRGVGLIQIGVKNIETTQPKLRAYAEVWGIVDLTKQAKAACWIGGLVDISENFVTLELNFNWLKLAGVSGPLTLKNVYLSDIKTNFPVSKFDADMPVINSELLEINVSKAGDIKITKEMLYGVNPLKKRNSTAAAAAANLLILPGYCSSNNPFAADSASFTNAAFFSQKLNLPHDDYSQKVMAFADSQNMDSYSLIGHSQGGMVSLHMHNYYFSGLDSAQGGKLIQSVGTPFYGNTAAGSVADIGKVFGVGCGTNNDLSRDGAVNWMTGISSASQKEVHFYTTTYKQGTFFGDYCNLPANLLLQWPNDGTTEIPYASLQFGNFMGNKQEWCHTSGMKYSAQTSDSARNKEMNAAAAR